MTHRTGPQAVAAALKQSKSGPKFGVGECKQRVRELFNVLSDGAATASIAWGRTDHRIKYSADMPIGTLIWWTGGSPTKNHPSGAGHVVVYAGNGNVWSTDVKRNGYFDLVPFTRIEKWAPRLKYAGCSLDIEGVQVIPTPVKPKPVPKTPNIDAAIASTKKAIAASKHPAVKTCLQSALHELVSARTLRGSL